MMAHPSVAAGPGLVAVPSGLAAFLGSVERELTATMVGAGMLEQAARPMVLAHESKRARPMVAWLVGEQLGVAASSVMDAAIAVELVHAASLLHDDVIDGATERRGLPSANARWGATIAVLSGDLLLTSALRRLRGLGPVAMARAIDVVAEMTRAVAFEVAMRRRADLSPEAWCTMAEGKTGALFGIAAWLVAMAGGEPAKAERYDLALRRLGVAFQIADDIGDLAEDLADGNPSYPVLLAASSSPTLPAALDAAWCEPGVDTRSLVAQVVATGAMTQAVARVQGEIAAARALLAVELARGEPSSGGAGVAALFAWAASLATSSAARYPRAADGSSEEGEHA